MLSKVTVNKKLRFPVLDKVRGLAVLLMLLSHSIDFFYSGDLFFVEFLRWFTATVAFTTFIYVSGASNYIANIDHAGASEVWQKKKLHILLKTMQLLLVYYVVAFILGLLDLQIFNFQTISSLLGEILILKNIPTYTEFILAFIFLYLTLVFFGRAYKFILKNSVVVLAIGLNMYILGMLLYQVDFGPELNHYKALFVGHDQGYQFPVFQYFPVYLFGMKFGKELLNTKKIKLSWAIQLLLLCVITFVFAINKTWQPVTGEGFVYLQRWPPSISFLVIGVVFVQILIIVYKFSSNIFKSNSSRVSFIEFIGKNPLDFYVIHILLLELYKTFIGSKTGDFIYVFLGFLTLVLIVSTIVFVKQQFRIIPRLNIEDGISGIIEKTLGSAMKHVYRAIAMILLISLVVVVLAKINISGNEKLTIADEGFVQGVTAPAASEDIIWWNKDYKYYVDLTITNTDSEHLLPDGSWLALEIDHQALVNSQKSLSTGEDLALVHLNNGVYQELDIFVDEPNTNSAKVYFEILDNLAPNSSVSGYYLYYGNKHVTAQAHLKDKPDLEDFNYKIEVGEEQSAQIITNLSRKWYLKDYADDAAENKTVIYKIQVTSSKEVLDDEITVTLTDSDNNATRYKPDKIESNIFELTIPVDQLDPQEYSIKTTVEDKNYESDVLNFNVSYPLFVAWTIDWEGYDVSEENLKAMDTLANRFDMPLTTLFNPRVFIATDIPQNRKTRLVDWALAGQKQRGDEIGLHLHMHLDMIAAAGLEPKTEPRWGGRENGHDVLTSAYEYDEFKQIVEWSLTEFAKNRLPEPVSYRAGGWFIDEENLKVLSDLGFKIDSSGREPIVYGPNKIENPWFLSSTTKPFKPSSINQNSGLEPTLDIWEFPNNGMDSTNRDYDILIQKFNDNYKNQPLQNAQVVTYLSHPHWFMMFDNDDMRKVLEFVEKYKYENDGGAVVYGTLEGVLGNGGM